MGKYAPLAFNIANIPMTISSERSTIIPAMMPGPIPLSRNKLSENYPGLGFALDLASTKT